MFSNLHRVFSCFHEHNVKYVVIGGVAAIIHGVPRLTLDLDILIDPSIENATHLLLALRDAGLSSALMTEPQSVLDHEISVFNDYVRIDVQTSTPGLRFSDAWSRRVVVQHAGQSVFVVSRDDLIASKRATARPIDLEDVAMLEQNPSGKNG
jgi:hypothetical protein